MITNLEYNNNKLVKSLLVEFFPSHEDTQTYLYEVIQYNFTSPEEIDAFIDRILKGEIFSSNYEAWDVGMEVNGDKTNLIPPSYKTKDLQIITIDTKSLIYLLSIYRKYLHNL